MMPVQRRAQIARWIGAAALGATLAAAGLATAQTKGRPVRRPIEDAGAMAAPPPAAVSPEAGPVPAPAQDESIDGGRLSPLNPAPNEFSDAGPASDTADYDRLLADVAALRARVAAVSDTLFHSRIAISVEARGDHGRIAAMSISLDDGVVWTAPASFRPSDATVVYEHAVAPGHHAVTLDVERRDDRNDAFRSTQRSRFIMEVPTDQKLSVDLQVTDDSGMGADFPGDRRGQYELRVRARAQAQAIGR
jgi:hypothetical protein